VEAQRQRRKRREEERDITAIEIEEITDDKTIEDDPDVLEKKVMMEEWDAHMSDFVPDDMLTVELQPREEISLHEDASKDPLYIRGAYFVNAAPGTEKSDRLITSLSSIQTIKLFLAEESMKRVYLGLIRRCKDNTLLYSAT